MAKNQGGSAKGKSKISEMIGKKGLEAFEEVKDEDVVVRGRLPGNVRGVAKLNYVKFDEFKTGDNKGKTYFTGRGTVVEPKEYAGLPIFMQNEPMFDTPNAGGGDRARKTQLDHVREVANRLKLLGLDANDLKPANLEKAIRALNESDTYFRFETWQPKKRQKGEPGYNEKYDGPNAKEPDVRVTWGLAIPDYDAGESDDDDDDTGEDEADEAEAEDEESSDDEGEAEESEDEGESEGEDEEASDDDDEGEDEEIDWLALAKKADKGKDGKVGQQIQKKALELGISAKDLKNPDKYPDWKSVAEAIIEKESGEGEGEEDEDEEAVEAPSVGDKVKYKHPKTKKVGAYKVTAVDEDESTCTLVDVKDKTKKVKDVAFSDLITE